MILFASLVARSNLVISIRAPFGMTLGGTSTSGGIFVSRGDFYIFDLTQGSFEAPRGIGFVRICESPPIKKLLNQGWCGLLLRGGPVRHLGDAAGVNLDRCGGRP